MSEAQPAWALTAEELASLYRTGAATPDGVLETVLQRLEKVNPRLNAVVTIDRNGALEAAAQASARFRAGAPLGPLDGVPLTVKDNLFVRGLRATWGSLLFSEFVAPQDDLPVAKLRAAGAVIIGKTNTPELALSGTTDNRIFGSTSNPWNLDMSPGGSSGGAVAAVGSGCGPFALATDAGGSIRRPAGHAGVAGLKPGLGRVPRRFGVPPLAHDLQVIGPIARSVADLAAVFAAIAVTPRTAPVASRKLRIGAFGAIGDAPVEPDVTRAFDDASAALRELGHTVEPIAPMWDPDEVNTLFAALCSVGVARVMARFKSWQELVTGPIAQLGQAGAQRTAAQYAADLDRLTDFRWRMLDAIASFDAVATPSSPAVAWPRSEPYPRTIGGREAGPRAAAIFSTAINLAGLPAVVVPAPVASGALPVGLQLIGPMESEEALLALAAQFESVRPWPRLAPI